ncbi:MAG: hypothetical protein AAB225_21970 [Acidobacteriota bacterium]
MGSGIKYRCPPQVAWTVESDGILLLNAATASSRRLRYPEAAVWDWISRGESCDRIMRKTAAVAKMETETARRLVLEAVRSWVEAGFLVVENGDG